MPCAGELKPIQDGVQPGQGLGGPAHQEEEGDRQLDGVPAVDFGPNPALDVLEESLREQSGQGRQPGGTPARLGQQREQAPSFGGPPSLGNLLIGRFAG